MGGAFVAVADDATAAYSNPAGLVILSRPEVSAEGRGWGFTTVNFNLGHGFGPPSLEGTDTIEGLVDKSFSSEAAGPSFLSFVYPTEKWSLAVFAHQLSRFNTEKEIEGPFFSCGGGYRNDDPPRAPFCEVDARDTGVDRLFPKRQSIDLDIWSAGASFAFKFSDDFSIGVSGLYYTFKIDSWNRVFSARSASAFLGGARDDLQFAPPDFTYPDNLELESTQAGQDNAFGATVGLLWSPLWNLTFGASFRQGPKFNFELKTVVGAAHPCVGETRLAACDKEIPVGYPVAETANPFKVPDTYAIGFAFRPFQTLTISFEYDRVRYSQMIEELRDPARPSEQESAVVLDGMRLDDSNQFRMGLEYLKLFRTNILAMQLGAWYDPDHQMQFDASVPDTGFPAPRWALLFPAGRDAWHFTAGLGFVFSEHLQIDAGVDFSDPVKTLSVSTVVMF